MRDHARAKVLYESVLFADRGHAKARRRLGQLRR
jgi:hypothetical protein